jgi:hypothetical protein
VKPPIQNLSQKIILKTKIAPCGAWDFQENYSLRLIKLKQVLHDDQKIYSRKKLFRTLRRRIFS